MHILIISGDPSIADKKSPARARMRLLSSAFDAMHVVVIGSRGTIEQEDRLVICPAYGRNRIRQTFRAYRHAVTICRREPMDVVSAQGPDETGVVAYIISRRFRIPFQLQLHTDVLSPWYRRASWKEYARYRLALFLIPRARCIRVVSERIQRSLVAARLIASERVSVLPLYIDISGFLALKRNDDGVADRPFTLLAVGRFVEREKHFLMLLDVLERLIPSCPAVRLVMAGDGPDRAAFERAAHARQLANRIQMEGWREHLIPYYQQADLFVSVSNYEGWGVAVLEAMASGVPVVMTDVGLVGEVVKDGVNGRVVPVGNAARMAEAIISLYRNPSQRILMATEGRRAAARYAANPAGYASAHAACMAACVVKGMIHYKKPAGRA